MIDDLYRATRDDHRARRLLIDNETRLSDRALLQRTISSLLYRESVTAYLTLEAQGLVTLTRVCEPITTSRFINVSIGNSCLKDVRSHADSARGELSFVVSKAASRNRAFNFCRRLYDRVKGQRADAISISLSSQSFG